MSVTEKSMSRGYRALAQMRDILWNPHKYPRDARYTPRLNRWRLKQKIVRERRVTPA